MLRSTWLKSFRTWFRHLVSVRQGRRGHAQRCSPARGRKLNLPVEPLEVRTLLAGEFTDLNVSALTGVVSSSVAWGDADNDGDLDILLTGKRAGDSPTTRLYRNEGSNTFVDSNASLPAVYSGSVAWGDADNDGDLDILLTGVNVAYTPIARVYRNDGNNTFTDVNAGLVGVGLSSAAWGDVDNDGDLDVIVTGSSSWTTTIPTTKIYRNDGNNTFVDVNAGIPGVSNGSVALGDADNDNDLDVLISGYDSGNTPVANIYRNNGDNTYTNLNAGLAGVGLGSVAWGDADNDGDLDVLVSGRTASSSIAAVYRNNGDTTFSNLNVGLTSVDSSSVAWGDVDNDGYLDILLTGQSAGFTSNAKVYRNNGNATFTDLNAGLTGVVAGSVSFGDSDNDGDLDILLTGLENSGNTKLAKIYRNNAATANTKPSAPTALTSSVASPTALTLAWTAATDSQTPASGLSYNLRVGSTPGASDVFSTMAISANGNRRLPDSGPIQGTSYTLKGLDSTRKYYWSVQAIDTAFAGGTFASEQTANFPFVDLGPIDTSNPFNTGVFNSSLAWGDYDNDNDMDILLNGVDSANSFVAKILRNNGDNTFTNINAGLTGVANGAVAWGDYNNDGFLDALVTGRNAANVPRTSLYANSGTGSFSALNFGLTDVSDSAVAWGDADNDGDLDLLLTGRDASNARITKLYGNDGHSNFTVINVGLPGISDSAVAWGDADNDGDLDILLSGVDATNARIARVYRNNGNTTFTDINAGLTGVVDGSIAWGDADNDGDLDILLTGQDSAFAPVAKVYANNGGGLFMDLNAGLTAVSFSSAAWGDADNDGDLDILLAGSDASFTRTTKLFRNNGNNTFTDLNAPLTGVDSGTVAWGDIDNDGDLDILLSGADASFNFRAKAYLNNAEAVNSAPLIPTGLTTTIASATSLTFSWTAPSDAQTPTAGLSYNLRVGTTPGGSDVFTTMSKSATGRRRLPDAGPIQGTSHTLKNLTPGTTYYWSVQAVDTALVGGAFAVEQSKFLPAANTVPVIGGAVANQAVNDNATKAVFSTLTVTDPDTNPMSATVTILNGVVRGDFTPATTAGWTRTVSGNNIRYARTYSSAANIGATVQAAIRAFVFQPRSNAIKPNTIETTAFTVTVTDGIAAPVSNSTTSVITASVNNAPTFGGTSANVAVNDNATVNPLAALTVSDVDTQELLVSVTILNGVVRGDFTSASTVGWAVRYTTGNDITYKRYFSPQANVGAAAQAAFRALVFQPRQNAINPGTTEATDFQVTVSDGVAPAVLGTGTRVTTTSVNNVPTIGGAVAGQTMNDNQTKAVFSTLTITDPDKQDQFVRITITGGTTKGDFTSASTVGWTRKTSGTNLLYERFFAAAANNGAVVQSAIRTLVFQPRNNVPIGITETTSFTVFVNDGIANTTNSTTTVITTGIAPRPAPATPVAPSLFLDSEIATVVLPTVRKIGTSPLARMVKKSP